MFYFLGLALLLASFSVGGVVSNISKSRQTKVDTSMEISVPTLTPASNTSPTITPKPSLAPTIIPTEVDKSENLVDCKCGDDVQQLKSSECSLMVCCNIDGKTQLKTSDDCQKISDEKYKKDLDEYNQKLLEFENDNNKADQEFQDRLAALEVQNEKIRIKNLEICRKNAQEQYKQQPMGASSEHGYVVGESPELRQKLNSALQSCLDRFGK